MNTRQAIQPPNTPAVLSLSFSVSRNRFIAGLSTGLRVLRPDNCLTTYQPEGALSEGGIAIAEALDDRYIAFVAGGRTPAGSPNVVIFWDCIEESEVCRFDIYEPILGLRLNEKWMVVVLRERTVVFEYQELQPKQQATPPPDDDEQTIGPNKVKAIHPTTTNSHAQASLRKDLLVVPAQTIGQVQLIPLAGGSKRVLRAHNTALRQLSLSPSGNLLATASEQGTLIRVFNTSTLDQIAELRRGVEKAIVYSLAFSDNERWLACTSDKGTVHIFDLQPPAPATAEVTAPSRVQQTQHRKSSSQPTQAHRLSANLAGKEASLLSGRSSTPTTSTPGSIQEYYGLRPPPSSASPSGQNAGISALSAFKSSAFAPKVLKDVRSIASLPFHTGNDPPHWQGGASYSWTTAPGGTRKRVRNAVLSLPNEPNGRPPKGVVAFAPKKDGDEGELLWVLGGGSDARWEMFELLPAAAEGGRAWVLVFRGFRRFLGRQFVD